MSELKLRYKYVPRDASFDDTLIKGSLSIIKDGTMKFTHPKDFNDPFDCYPEIDIKKFSECRVRNKEFRKKYMQEK